MKSAPFDGGRGQRRLTMGRAKTRSIARRTSLSQTADEPTQVGGRAAVGARCCRAAPSAAPRLVFYRSRLQRGAFRLNRLLSFLRKRESRLGQGNAGSPIWILLSALQRDGANAGALQRGCKSLAESRRVNRNAMTETLLIESYINSWSMRIDCVGQ
jgi:hypothetical protein